MKEFLRVFYFFNIISIVLSQNIEKNVVLNDLNEAVYFAHQNNLNVLIEDFTGVG